MSHISTYLKNEWLRQLAGMGHGFEAAREIIDAMGREKKPLVRDAMRKRFRLVNPEPSDDPEPDPLRNIERRGLVSRSPSKSKRRTLSAKQVARLREALAG